MEPTTQMSYGQKSVGLTFNPSNDPDVQNIKELYAKIIDALNVIVEKEPTYTEKEVLSRKGQILNKAIDEAITAQMWAVKGITYNL